MSYNSTYPRVEYTAAAGQTVFPFLFKVFADADIIVYNLPIGTDPETAAALILNIDYTVDIYGDDGGQITLTVGAEDGASITIYRELEINRFIEYQTSGDLLSSTLNLDQDYQTYIIADLIQKLDAVKTGGVGTTGFVKITGDSMTGTLSAPDIAVTNNITVGGKSIVSSEDIIEFEVLTQAEYDALTPVSTTMYVIVG